MSGLEALGIVCNIVQVIDTACKTVALCKDIYDGKAPDGPLSEKAASLHLVSLQIQALCQTWQQNGQDEHELELLAKKCSVAARELNEEVAYITTHQKKGDWLATIRVAAKTNWRKRRLDRLSQSLQNWQRMMETHLIRRICTQNTARELEESRRFNNLDESLQKFVSKLSAGETRLAALVHQEGETTRAQIASQAVLTEQRVLRHTDLTMSKTGTIIASHVTESVNDAVDKLTQESRQLHLLSLSEDARNRFLRSFKFAGMNQRVNQVSEACKGTFSWIFKGPMAPKNTRSRISRPYIREVHVPEQESSDEPYSTSSRSSDRPGNRSTEIEWNSSEDESYSGDSEDPDTAFPIIPKEPPRELWDNFADWLRSENTMYWISGKPGSGKSTLMRYLTDSRETKDSLNTWRPEVAILSHFFWKPGSQMQQSMKGLYCSLLHQLFSKCQDTTALALQRNPDFVMKDSDVDWSPSELKSVFHMTLQEYPRPLCIFLDGLDEALRDETSALLETIDVLQSLPDIKVCVSSRPESRFQARFQQNQQLRLQDLTYNDMCKVAQKQLQPLAAQLNDTDEVSSYRLLRELADKAEGVFLWLVLAVQSLTRGIHNGDPTSLLLARLEVLPSDLISLYSEMWNRLGDDKALYQQRASVYLNVMMLMMQIPSDYPKNKVLHVMAATDYTLQESAIENDLEITDVEIIEKCRETEKAIRRYCAGLLETYDDDSRGSESGIRLISFVHRSAYDFVVDTEEGRQLCQNSTTTPGQNLLQLARGLLMSAKCPEFCRQYDTLPNAMYLLGQVKGPELQPRIWDLFNRCQQWYDERLLHGPSNYADPDDELDKLSLSWVNKPHFLSCSSDPCFTKYALAQISQQPDPTKIATRVLREIFRVGHHDPMVLAEYIERLLAAGADPNRKGSGCISDLSFLELKTVSEKFILSLLPDMRHGYVNWYMLDHLPSLAALLRITPDLHSRMLICFHGNLNGRLYLENDIYRNSERYGHSAEISEDGKFTSHEVTFVTRPNLLYLLALSVGLKYRGLGDQLQEIFSATLKEAADDEWTAKQCPQVLYVIIRSPGELVSWASGRIWQPSSSRSRQISTILNAKRAASLVAAPNCDDDISSDERVVRKLVRRVISDVTAGDDYEEIPGTLWDRLVERGHPLVSIEKMPQYFDTA